MSCLFGLLALFVPRIVIVVVWFTTNWFTGIFDSLLWPILGLIFLPTTLLWYSVVINVFDGVWGPIPIIGAIVAVAIDLSPAKSRR